jgi:hypothetical protein
LFLCGRTQYHGRRYNGYTHSWLSPASIHVTQRLQMTDQRVSFFSCLPDMSSGPFADGTVCLLKSVVWDVLQWHTDILRTKERELSSKLSLCTSETNVAAAALFSVLMLLLSELPETKVVHIILDRVDHCDRLDYMMKDWVRILHTAAQHALKTKILAISEISGGRGFWNADFLSSDLHEIKILHPDPWNQTKLSQDAGSLEKLIWTDDGLDL